ncbi:MAG TPA: hypothetical protein VMK16_11650 [Acidimicrobiales bacterium]|nr:hypothetical protein [Acidimicrobiales bacterium]
MKRTRLMGIALAGAVSFGTLALAAGPAGAQTSTTTPEAAADNTSCPAGHWPGWVDGRPAGVHPRGAQGVYLWHDGYGWHLRVTHRGTDKQVFEVKISAPSGLYGVERLTEQGDVLINDGTTLLMRFTNYGGLDGVDFRVRCGAGITVNTNINGVQASPLRVVLGRFSAHPTSVPFAIERIG